MLLNKAYPGIVATDYEKCYIIIQIKNNTSFFIFYLFNITYYLFHIFQLYISF